MEKLIKFNIIIYIIVLYKVMDSYSPGFRLIFKKTFFKHIALNFLE